MRVQYRPADPIFDAAWSIADAIAYRQSQSVRLELEIKRNGIMTRRTTMLSNDIVRLDALVQERIKKWDEIYAPQAQSYATNWFQYLDGHPEQAKVEMELA
jgi:hypothetical protein